MENKNLEVKKNIIDVRSCKTVPSFTLEVKELTSNDKLVYQFLFSSVSIRYAGDVLMSHSYIGEKLDISRTAVFNSLHRLKEIGLIAWSRNNNSPNSYYLLELPDWIIKKYA